MRFTVNGVQGLQVESPLGALPAPQATLGGGRRLESALRTKEPLSPLSEAAVIRAERPLRCHLHQARWLCTTQAASVWVRACMCAQAGPARMHINAHTGRVSPRYCTSCPPRSVPCGGARCAAPRWRRCGTAAHWMSPPRPSASTAVTAIRPTTSRSRASTSRCCAARYDSRGAQRARPAAASVASR